MVKRKLETIQIQLDILKEDQAELFESVKMLKAAREFSQVFRDAIRLFLDLREGNTDVLFELFPGLKAKLSGPSSGELEDHRQRIRRLEDMLMQNSVSQSPYHMVEQPLPPVVMKPPGATTFGGTKVRDPDGKGSGAAANNLLASLDKF